VLSQKSVVACVPPVKPLTSRGQLPPGVALVLDSVIVAKAVPFGLRYTWEGENWAVTPAGMTFAPCALKLRVT
jgi:hypothetical protein